MKAKLNGIEIAYFVSGKEDGPPVMMSHSLGSSSLMWAPQLTDLEEKFRVIRFDTRGHGSSSAPSGAYSLDQLGDDAIALMDYLNLEKVHWVGLSMGGMIAQNVALRYPDRLLSLTLCDTMSQIPDDAQKSWEERISAARLMGMTSLVDATMERWFTYSYLLAPGPEFAGIKAQFELTPSDGFIGCGEAIRQLDYLSQLHKVKLPTLIIVGEDDPATPVIASKAMHDEIEDSSLVVLPNASHLSNVEQAEEFNQHLLSFLNSQ